MRLTYVLVTIMKLTLINLAEQQGTADDDNDADTELEAAKSMVSEGTDVATDIIVMNQTEKVLVYVTLNFFGYVISLSLLINARTENRPSLAAAQLAGVIPPRRCKHRRLRWIRLAHVILIFFRHNNEVELNSLWSLYRFL